MAYVFLMRFLGVVQAIQEHPQYKQKRTEFDKIISVKNMTEAMDKAEKLADSLSQRYGCTCTYSYTYVYVCVKILDNIPIPVVIISDGYRYGTFYVGSVSIYHTRSTYIRTYCNDSVLRMFVCTCIHLFVLYVHMCLCLPAIATQCYVFYVHTYVDTLQGMSPKMIFLSRWTRRNQLLKNRILISLINRLLLLWSCTICCRNSQKKYAAHFCCPSLLYIVIYHCVLCPGVGLGLPSQVRMGFLSR